MKIRAEWIADERRWRELQPSWDDVVLRSSTPSIYATWAFVEACWTHFARPLGDSLAVVALFEGETLVGLAPFRIHRRRKLGFTVRELNRLAAWESDRVPPLLSVGPEAAHARALSDCLAAQASRWDSIRLLETDPDWATVRRLLEWASTARALRTELEPTEPSPYLDLTPGWQAVLQTFSKVRRAELRRSERALNAAGGWAFEVEEHESVGEALASYLEVESRSWKPAAGQGVAKNERTLTFYRDLLPRLAAEGRTSIGFLRLGEKRIAAMVDLVLGNTVWGAQKTYDRELARLSPGNFLEALTLERWTKRGARSYELQAQYVSDKGRWTRLSHSNARLAIYQLRTLRQRVVFPRAWLRRRPVDRVAGVEGESGE